MGFKSNGTGNYGGRADSARTSWLMLNPAGALDPYGLPDRRRCDRRSECKVDFCPGDRRLKTHGNGSYPAGLVGGQSPLRAMSVEVSDVSLQCRLCDLPRAHPARL